MGNGDQGPRRLAKGVEKVLRAHPELIPHFQEAEDVLEGARYVRTMRKGAGLTQSQLAEKLGITQPRISSIEKGEGAEGITYVMLKKIARACELDWPPPPIPEAYTRFAPFIAVRASGLTHKYAAMTVKNIGVIEEEFMTRMLPIHWGRKNVALGQRPPSSANERVQSRVQNIAMSVIPSVIEVKQEMPQTHLTAEEIETDVEAAMPEITMQEIDDRLIKSALIASVGRRN